MIGLAPVEAPAGGGMAHAKRDILVAQQTHQEAMSTSYSRMQHGVKMGQIEASI
jgi:hypothetical protein